VLTTNIPDSAIAEVAALSEANKPHWRLFLNTETGNVTVLEIQPYEYITDEWAGIFLSEEWFTTEVAAERALDRFLVMWDAA
jgi:hypothetical protein